MNPPLTWSRQFSWNQQGVTWNGRVPKKDKTMTNHVSLGFAQLPDAPLVVFATGVHDHLVASAATFTNPPVTVVALKAATDDFDAKLGLAHKGSVAQTADKDDAREVLLELLRELAAYVEGKALGNANTIRLGGFDVTTHAPAPQAPLAKPAIKVILNLMTTQLRLRVTAIPNAYSYVVQFRTGTGAWLEAGVFPNTRSIVVINLVPGTLYEFRVRAIGGSTGTSDWSDAVSHMAT